MHNKVNNFGIYIHWPFCLSKCPYCDFFSQVKKDIPQDEIIADYIEELDFYHENCADRKVSSIFFGGGTPSLIEPRNISKIINHIQNKWYLNSDAEISLEANPNTNQKNLFKDLRSSGINRLSLGVQALNDEDLKFLGRTHNRQEALQAIDDVMNSFDNQSIDLIYARPHQKLESWKNELKETLSFGTKHISLYQLTIEEGTLFSKQKVVAMDEEQASEMYDATEALCQDYGYEKYEISNFAQKGFASQHNLLYWQGHDYLGIGKSAHGRISHNGKIYATTYRKVMEELTAKERAEELILMGLRIKEGINKQNFHKQCGLTFDEFVNKSKLNMLKDEEYIIDTSTSIKATKKGFLVLNRIIEELIF